MNSLSNRTAAPFCIAAQSEQRHQLRRITRRLNRFLPNVVSAFFLMILMCPAALCAQPNTIIDPNPITWNIVGLDSNELIGPQDFPMGVRVVNNGTVADTNVTAKFEFTSPNLFIDLIDDDTISTTTLEPGEYIDFYFTVRVTRDDAVRKTGRDYKITIDSENIGTPIFTTDTVFVENLVSQQSNSVLSLVGPNAIQQGQVRTFTLSAETATGRDQVTQFVNFPNDHFQILDVQTHYSIPGITIDKIYADGCGWDRTLLPPTNQSCIGPEGIPGGKAGGSITAVYNVLVLKTPTAPITLTTLIMDVTGTGFKYNTDFGHTVLEVKPPADLFVVKSAMEDPVEAGETVEYLISVVNASNNLAEDVVLSDTLPLGLTFLSATPPPASQPDPLIWNIGNVDPMTTVTFTVIAQSSCDFTGMLTNTAFVSASTDDENLSNNLTTHTVLIQDTTPPEITCPASISFEADAGLCSKAGVTYSATAVDNCGQDVTITFDPPSGSTLPVGETVVTATAKDTAGNMSMCNFTVTVTDTAPPVLSCLADIDVNAEALACSVADAGVTTPTATDNCTQSPVVAGIRSDLIEDVLAPYPVGVTTIVWTATDAANNQSSCTQTVTVRDVTDPVISCPGNVIVSADQGECQAGTVTFEVTATDNCSTQPVTVVTVPPSGSSFPIGDTQVLATATDAAGNEVTCTFTVTVNDGQAPVIECGPTINVQSDVANCSATLGNITPPTFTDNCTGAELTYERSDMLTLNDPFPVGTTTITWKVTDGSGLVDTCTQLVVVEDAAPPTIECANAIVVPADPGECEAGEVILIDPVTSDNCTTASVVFERSDMLGRLDPFPVGPTTVVWTVFDEAGNSTSCTQTVTVEDTIPPTIECPATINVETEADSCEAVNVTITPPTLVSDNCSETTVTGSRSDQAALDAPYPLGTTVITWTVVDAAGNMASCDQEVVVSDNTAPTIECGNTINVSSDIANCSATAVNITPPAVSDNCSNPGNITLDAVRDDGLDISEPYPVGTTTITWTATDSEGNTVTCIQLVVVTDDVDPDIVCANPINVAADAVNCTAANVTIIPPVTDDNCGTATLTFVRSDDANLGLNDPFPLGVTTITWTVTDTNNNSSSCVQTVTVTDETAPAIDCPDTIIQANDAGVCGAVIDYTVTVTDACGNSSVTLECTPAPGSLFPVGSTMVTCTATDEAGNESTCSFEVVITDNQNPDITCPPDVMSCMQDMIELGQPTITDNCSSVSLLSVVRSDGLGLNENYPIGQTVVTYTAIDDAGNMDVCQQNVVISEDALPMIGCPDDFTTNALLGQCATGPIEYPSVNVMDNCSTDTTNLTITFDPPAGTNLPVGVTTVTVTVKDADGNTDMCQFAVTVLDITPPLLTCPNDITVNSTTGQCGAASVTFQLSAEDTCSLPVVVTSTPASGSAFPIGTTTVVVTATDAAGNEATCRFDVTVLDAELPTIECPPTVNVMADAGQCEAAQVNLGVPVVDDNCTGVNQPTGVRDDGLALNAPYPVGTTTVTWTVTDNAGNQVTCDQTVIVRDTMMPEITCPDNIVVEALSGECQSGPVQYSLPIISDNCTTDPATFTITFDPPQNSTFPVGVSTVTVTVADMSGNQSTCTFTVTVNDITPPQLTCPENIAVNSTDGQCDANNVTFNITATDQCPGAVTVVATPPSGSSFPIGVTTVNVVATDAAGNEARCSFEVLVTDNQPPTIQCPAVVDVTANAECMAVDVTIGTPVIDDNCLNPVLTSSRSDGLSLNDPYPIGVTEITWTVTDASENVTTCTQLVTVSDASAPVITCQADINVSALQGQCVSGPVEFQDPVVTDNCSTSPISVTIAYDPPSGSSFPIGETVVTATATDEAGNEATCEFLVIVDDVTSPTINCPSSITVSSTPGECGASSVTYEVTAEDSCSTPVVVTVDPPSGSFFPIGTTPVTATAVDAAGNVATCTFTVTVTDAQAPTIMCPSAMVVATSPGQCQANNVTYSAITSDNCEGPVQVTFNPPSGSNLSVGVHTITAIAEDAAGNTASCTFTVTVEDLEIPRLECSSMAIITASTEPCETTAFVPLTPPVALDQCGEVDVLFFRQDALTITDPFPVGQTLILWVAIDSSGNLAGCEQIVEVIEAACQPECGEPQIICGDHIKGMANGCDTEAFVELTIPQAFNDCGPLPVTGVRSDGRPLTDSYPIGDTTITWTTTDGILSASCSYNVWIDPGSCALACDGPDLIIMNKMMPMFECKGKKKVKCTVSAWYVVTNIGTQPSQETEVCFYLSDDEVLDGSDFKLKRHKKNHAVKSLLPGEMVGVDLKAKGPKGYNVAGKFLLAVTDCPNRVNECLEDNNMSVNFID